MSLILKLLNLVVSTQYILSKKDHEDLILDHAFILRLMILKISKTKMISLITLLLLPDIPEMESNVCNLDRSIK
jgi:hypothetical protein